MTTPSFYRRPLPSDQIPFGSFEGRRLFGEALAAGTLEGYFALAEQFHTQAEPAFCGLGSLVVALNALQIDPGRLWKGPWRWYSEELLDCCLPLEEVKALGITLSEFACLARCNNAATVVHYGGTGRQGMESLRAQVRAASSVAGEPVVVASYSRARLGQTGDGHFSPLGGYHQGQDRVLVLDVARFKYPPHWVRLQDLWEAMEPPDPTTGLPRGYVIMTRREEPGGFFFALVRGQRRWQELFEEVAHTLPQALESRSPGTIKDVVEVIDALSLPGLKAFAQTPIRELLTRLAPEHQRLLNRWRQELRSSPLWPELEAALEQTGLLPEEPATAGAEVLAQVLLMLPPQSWSGSPQGQPPAALALAGSPEHLPPLVKAERQWLGQWLEVRQELAPG